MVGTGVFTTSGLLIADLGSAWLVLLTWLLGGVVALLGALCYGALARHIPESGGEYVFLSRTLHPALGYLAGWVSLLVGFAVPLGAVAFAFGQYMSALGGVASASPRLTGTVIILIATAVHAVSLTAGARAQAIAVAVELVVIALFIGFGTGQLVHEGLHNVAAPGRVAGLGVALVIVSYSYQGWNAAVYVGGEVAQPKRNLPRALVLGTVLVTALYLGLNAVFVLGAPASLLAGKVDVGRIAALVLGGPRLATLVSGLIAFVLAICVSSLAMAGPQVAARMAADGLLPRVLAVRPGRPPRIALLAQTAIPLSLARRPGSGPGAALEVPGWAWVPTVWHRDPTLHAERPQTPGHVACWGIGCKNASSFWWWEDSASGFVYCTVHCYPSWGLPEMNATNQIQTGQIFARYQIVRTIGEGGMGTVYEAFHPALKKRFAIKTLLPAIAQTPEFRTRFLREAEVAARINHPNIVRVTDVGCEGDIPYMVMEFLEGQTLGRLLAEPRSPGVSRDSGYLAACAFGGCRRSCRRHHSSRSQAGEHLSHPGAVGRSGSQGARLWCLEVDDGRTVGGAHRDADGAGHRRLYVP
jgi:APA family basic amino acid/polyamine antiporter